MTVGERRNHWPDEQHGGHIADKIGKHEHGSADGEKLRSDAAVQSRHKKMNEVGDRAGVFESLHDDEERGEEKKQFPIDAVMNAFGFDASDDEHERADSRGGERKRKIHGPQDKNKRGGDSAFDEQRAIQRDGNGFRMSFERRRVCELAPEENCQDGNVEQKSHQRDGREVEEKAEKSEMRGDADKRVLRISGDGHYGADVRRSGERDEIRKFGKTQAVGDGENDGREDEADGVVDEKCGEDSRGEDEQHEKLKARAGERGDMNGNPVEKMRDLEMRDEDHDAEKKNDGVPTDRAIRAVERDDSRKHHGDGSAECRSCAVKMAAASAFDGNQYVGDDENDDGEPVNLSEQRGEGLSGWKHQECGSLSRFVWDTQRRADVQCMEECYSEMDMKKKDDLLPLLSRAQFDEDLRTLADEAPARPLTLLFVDFDLFKDINDSYGHEAGDEVLMKAAQVLASISCGKGDAYRRGGDEMAVILPNHTVDQATVIAEDIRTRVEQISFECCSEKMTVSIGIACYPETVEDHARLFSLADTMMYRAKDCGGNCICIPPISGQSGETIIPEGRRYIGAI